MVVTGSGAGSGGAKISGSIGRGGGSAGRTRDGVAGAPPPAWRETGRGGSGGGSGSGRISSTRIGGDGIGGA